MTFNIYNVLILVGIIQGLIFTGAILCSKKYRSKSIYFLVALILCFSLSNLQYFLSDTGIITQKQMYDYVFMPWASLIPVLIYFYVVHFLYPLKQIKLQEKLLTAPFIIFVMLTIIFKIGRIVKYISSSFDSFFASILNLQEIIGVLLTIVILSMLIVKIFRFQKKQEKFKVEIVRTDLNWLKGTLIILIFLTIIWTYLAIKNIYFPESFTSFYILQIGMSAAIYWLGYVGIYKFGINEERRKIRKVSAQNSEDSSLEQSKNEHIVALENLLVKEKHFLDSNLTLESVAKKLQISKSYLSRIINAELKMSFTEYLNKLRIEEAKYYLKNPSFSNYTILAIGLEAGFNSKSSFFNVFKKITGSTPLDYKNIQMDK